MADEIVYKKMTRKADKGLEGKVIAKHGKQTNQTLKPYVVRLLRRRRKDKD